MITVQPSKFPDKKLKLIQVESIRVDHRSRLCSIILHCSNERHGGTTRHFEQFDGATLLHLCASMEQRALEGCAACDP